MRWINNLYNGRLNRTNYFLGSVVAIPIVFFFYIFVQILVAILTNTHNPPPFSPLVFLLLLCTGVYSFSLSVRRLHDIGQSGWLVLLSFVPIANTILNLFLLFKSGDKKANKYGHKPPKKITFPGDILGLK